MPSVAARLWWRFLQSGRVIGRGARFVCCHGRGARAGGPVLSAWLLRAAGVLLMLTALALALSRAPDRPVEGLVARWAQPPSDFIEVGGMAVHLRDEGPRDDPEPLVLLHGAGSSLHTWEGWARALRGQRRVLRIDLPGAGLTGPFGGAYPADDYRAETVARFVLDVLDARGIDRAVLVGNSFGGSVAWRIAVAEPARVSRLVLVDAMGPPFEPEAVPLGFVVARLPVLSRIGEHVMPRALVAQGLVQLYGHPERVTTELVDRHFELLSREGNRRALGLLLRQNAPSADDAARLARVRQPTLVLWGGRDRLIPPSVARDFERRIAGSQLVVFDDLGHLPHEEDPQRTLPPLRAFIGLPPT